MKALVTGGGGFLGSAIVRQLQARGDQAIIYSRGDYPALVALGAQVVRGDITDYETLRQAATGCKLIFHVAAKAGVWGPRADFERTNIEGTRTVLKVCRVNGPRRLVYTSSPSVVFTGHDQENLDETAPYPEHYETDYPRTKALAEREVLAATDLLTVALRPHLIWGPGDNHLIPRILARARAGQLRRVGDGKNLVDTVYIDNAAAAHLLAADRLHAGAALVGKAYFIAQGEPLPLWDLVNQILAAAGLPPVTRSVSPRLAYAAGWFLEGWHRLFCPEKEPRMTRFVARELATAHWFNLSAARRDLGYEAQVNVAEGLRRLRASFSPG